MKKKAYLSYFIEVVLAIVLCIYFAVSDYNSYDVISIILLILIYTSLFMNIIYTIKAKKKKEKMGIELLCFAVIWFVLGLSITTLIPVPADMMGALSLEIDAVMTIFILVKLLTYLLVLPITIVIMIIKYIKNFR